MGVTRTARVPAVPAPRPPGHRGDERPARVRARGPVRVPLCVPFWGRGTYAAIARCLAAGQVAVGPDGDRLGARLASLLGAPAAIPCASGRVALEAALRVLGVGPDGEVILPSFCCRSVVPPVLAVGARPVLADVGADMHLTAETVQAALTPRTRAVVVAHLFGNPVETEAVAAVCRPRGIAMIDDAAQSLGARGGGGMAGSLGDLGIVSFGKGKVCFGTGGGALVVSRPELLERARALHLAPPPAGGAGNALAVLVWRRWRTWSLPLARVLRLVVPQPGSADAGGPRAIRNVDAAVALSLLDTLPANLDARRARVDRYRRLLGGEPRLRLLPHPSGSACLTQVVHVGGTGRPERGAGAILRALRQRRYEVGPSYTPLHELPAYARFARRRLDGAGATWRDLIELPCEPGVPLAAVDAIAATVARALA